MPNIQIILIEIGLLVAGGLGFWLGQRGLSGLTTEIKEDLAFIKSKIFRDLPPAPITPVPAPTPVAPPQTVTFNIPPQIH